VWAKEENRPSEVLCSAYRASDIILASFHPEINPTSLLFPVAFVRYVPEFRTVNNRHRNP